MTPYVLLDIIETLRKELILIGMKEGLTSSKTIKISRELDKYITDFQTRYG
jgi:hypothetical protein